jgi:hypothetical protein
MTREIRKPPSKRLNYAKLGSMAPFGAKWDTAGRRRVLIRAFQGIPAESAMVFRATDSDREAFYRQKLTLELELGYT